MHTFASVNKENWKFLQVARFEAYQNRVLLSSGIIGRNDRISVESNITSSLGIHLLLSSAVLLLVIHRDGQLLGESTNCEGLGGSGDHLRKSAA